MNIAVEPRASAAAAVPGVRPRTGGNIIEIAHLEKIFTTVRNERIHALNDISLRWMLRKAIAAGLPMQTDCVGTGCARVNIDGKIGENFDKILSRPREPKPDDRFHYTVSNRPRHVNPPDPCTRETELAESQI